MAEQAVISESTQKPPQIFSEDGKTVIVALDGTSISGPEGALGDISALVPKIQRDGANAVIGFYGMFEKNPALALGTAGILNLTLSTEGPNHLRKVLVGRVEQVGELGLAGASVHVNTTAPYEPEMLKILGDVSARCHELDVPLLAHMYPRTIINGQENHYEDLKAEDPEAYAKLVRHAARIAADLGADIIKVPYTGAPETFATVVESTYGVPVVMAGGGKNNIPDFLKTAIGAMEAGARGIAIGRNFYEQPFKSENELVLISLYNIVHRGMRNPHEAASRAEFFVTSWELEELLSNGFEPGMTDEGHARSYVPYMHLGEMASN